MVGLHKSRRSAAATALAVIGLAGFAPAAAAATAAQEGYVTPGPTTQDMVGPSQPTSGPAGGVLGTSEGGQTGSPALPASPSAALPFTGTDLGIIAGAGLLLVALGLALRRMAAQRHEPPLA